MYFFLHKHALNLHSFSRKITFLQVKQVLHLPEGEDNMELEIARLYVIFCFCKKAKIKAKQTKISRFQAHPR